MDNCDIEKLCFNKDHFSRLDFNVERFINLTRRRATLDQIHHSLKVYLLYLQNQMMDLINDDYADFVNLSSSLQSLRETIHRVSENIQNEWNQFHNSLSDLEITANSVNYGIDSLGVNKKAQISFRDRLHLLLALERLSKFINDRPENITTNWLYSLSRLVVDLEVWFNRVPSHNLTHEIVNARNHCYGTLRDHITETISDDIISNKCSRLAILTSLIIAIGGLEFAVARLSDEFQQVMYEKWGDRPGERSDLMKAIFEDVLKMRFSLVNKAKEHLQFTRQAEALLDRVIISALSALLEKLFPSVLIPLDNRLFHRCFLIAVQFVQNFPTKCLPETQHQLRVLLDKFSLSVYFKLETSDQMQALKEDGKPENFCLATKEVREEMRSLSMYSSNLLCTIRSIFSSEVYLDSLVDRIWDYLLRLLRSYLDWVDSIIDSQKQDRWFSLAILSKDIDLFDDRLLDLCLNEFWAHLRDLSVDRTAFGRCISLFTEQLKTKKKIVFDKLTQLLVAQISEHLSEVSEIPRQYRWIKRSAPTGFSPYLVSAFSLCEKFSDETAQLGWKNEEIDILLKTVVKEGIEFFCERAEKVINTVEQTGSSLQRFKQRKAGMEDSQQKQQSNSSPDSDEAKIRAQLVFDVNFAYQRCVERDINLNCITQLQNAVTSGQN